MKKLLKKKRSPFPVFKFDLKMKLTTLLLFVALFAMRANTGYAQRTKITLNLENASVARVIDEIESRTDFRFIYKIKDVDLDRKVSIKTKKERVTQVLEKLFAHTKTTYAIADADNQIFLRKRKAEKPKMDVPVSTSFQQRISGTVLDEDGNPLPGASIVEKVTTNGTTSDFDGNFLIAVADPNATLIVSYIGFTTKEVPINGQDNLEIVLLPQSSKLDEVVVVGYGTQKKVNLTGSVSSVKQDAIENRPITQASNALQGLSPGVFVNSNSGEAGNDIADIRIRGIGTLNDSSPLILVDGIEAPLNSVSPNDIETINVLKDAASASIYGTRGANGVILVTTKRGNFDAPTQINYDAYYGFASPTILPDMVWDNRTYLELYREAAINSGRNFNFDDADIERYDNIPSTDWMETLVKGSAPLTSHNLSFSGGTNKVSYYFSNGYLGQEGLLEGSNEFERYSSRLNVDAQLTEKLKFGTSISVFKRDGFITPKDVFGAGRGFTNKGSLVFSGAMIQHPITPVVDELGRYGSFEADLGIERNRPNGQAVADQETVEQDGLDLLGSAYLEYSPMKDLTFKGTFGINYQDDLLTDIRKEYITYDPVTGDAFTNGNGTRNVGNRLNQTATRSLNITTLLQANYGFDIKKSRFDFLAGFSREKATIDRSEIQEEGFGTQDVITVGQGTIVQTDGSIGDWALVSFFGRANYNYDGRYLLEANIRHDASSRFGANNRWATFPSFSAGWIVSGESFWKGNVVSFLKFRGSWGRLGNQSTNLFPFVSQVNLGEDYNGNPGGALTRLGNEDLKWEETTTTNLGVDLRMFNGKFGIEADYFTKRTEDILTDLDNPLLAGVAAPTTVNAATIENKGFEFLVNYNDTFGDFRVNLSVNATHVKNEVVALNPDLADDQDRIQLNRSDNVWLVRGEPIFAVFGHRMAGIFQSQEEIDNAPDHSFIGTPEPGDFRYTDANGDGVIDADDQTVIGNRQPEWLYGANFGFGYKGFELSGIIQGIGRAETWIARMYHPFPFAGLRSFWNDNRWTPENPSQTHPRLWVDRRGYNGQSIETADKQISYWVQDRAYIRLKNIQLGYTFSEAFLERSPFKRLRLYVNGENLWTQTDLDDLDPERFDRESHATAVLPQNRVISFGLNATF
ncbi:MAG: TonB-dependent receptor [Bacteroidota bacterium]